MADPVLNALDLMTMGGLDRPSYIEDPEEAIEQNRIDEYLRLLPALEATERRSQATIGPKETGPIEDFMSYIYTQPKAGPIIAALDDLTPGIPFYDVIPDPPDELPTGPEHGGNRGRKVAAGVDMALAAISLPHLLKKGVGRIATNIKRPKNYAMQDILRDAGHYGDWSSKKGKLQALGKMVKAVATDKPTYGIPMVRDKNVSQLLMREPLYRKQFGLRPRSLEELVPKGSLKGTKWDDYVDANVYITNPDGTLRFNPESEMGQAALQEIADPRWTTSAGGRDQTYGTALHRALGEYARTPLVKGAEYDPAIHRVNPYRNKYGKSTLSDVKSATLNKRLLEAIHGPDAKIVKDAGKHLDNLSPELEIDRVFYNDIWDFNLGAGETKELESYLGEIKSILFDRVPKTSAKNYRSFNDRQLDWDDPQLSVIERLKALKTFLTSPDVDGKTIHAEAANKMMRKFMNKIIDHVEIKGTAKYESGRQGQLGRKLVNVEDEDRMWKELFGDYLK
tara:strand:- start:205 stop:1728 length:1524 start_codon:yes stop_codon:yes gene_type:complete